MKNTSEHAWSAMEYFDSIQKIAKNLTEQKITNCEMVGKSRLIAFFVCEYVYIHSMCLVLELCSAENTLNKCSFNELKVSDLKSYYCVIECSLYRM